MGRESIAARLLAFTFLAWAFGPSGAAAADSYSVIYRFQNYGTGYYPEGGIAAAADGRLFGTTHNGGDHKCGTVFQLTQPGPGRTLWRQKIIHQVEGNSGNCAFPAASPVVLGDFIVGTTSNGAGLPPYGTVFRLRTGGGAYEVLHTFDKLHGAKPTGPLLPGGDGRLLYGTTFVGGPVDCPYASPGDGSGVLYQTGPAGGFRVLHYFGFNGSGSLPSSGLVSGPDGAMYGTTYYRCREKTKNRGKGVVFRVTTDGSYSVIFNFDDSNTTGAPSGRLVFGPDGTLYGTTTGGYGTAYALTPGPGPQWTFKLLHRFSNSEGYGPRGLVRDAAGNLYGTTQVGGAHVRGALFRLAPPPTGSAWTFTDLHDFGADAADGTYPNGDLILKSGVLYGTTMQGGSSYDHGTVFSFKLP